MFSNWIQSFHYKHNLRSTTNPTSVREQNIIRFKPLSQHQSDEQGPHTHARSSQKQHVTIPNSTLWSDWLEICTNNSCLSIFTGCQICKSPSIRYKISLFAMRYLIMSVFKTKNSLRKHTGEQILYYMSYQCYLTMSSNYLMINNQSFRQTHSRMRLIVTVCDHVLYVLSQVSRWDTNYRHVELCITHEKASSAAMRTCVCVTCGVQKSVRE